ncbi:hypothetical protein SKAU_G00331450 [Synaphobranchus kaupii]|uniref:CUB domain-containing protein n=1 Tax=Synaphobranchus kaupii TaxID=118154 RepID=A0A9Q1EL96_SYNKA|nr:hypothetical protein SKAU_G00331450 [Synaphobranchus kaupii]
MQTTPGSIWDAVGLLIWVLFASCFKTLGVHGQDGDGCGHTLLGTQSGTLASRNYPGTYPNGTRCEWRVRAPRGRTLRLAFGDFDLERSQDCATAGSLTIAPGNGEPPLGPLCGDLDPRNRKLVLNSSEVTILFLSGTHRSGRGFLLSYATDQQPDLISCLERGTHFTSQDFRAYCPAGCRDVTGDIWGQSSQGLQRHLRAVQSSDSRRRCVGRPRGSCHRFPAEEHYLVRVQLRQRPLSKTGSLSEKKLVFHKDCDSPLPVLSYNVSSSWEEVDSLGRRRLWSPENKDFAGQFLPWVADSNDPEPWLQLELRERSSITAARVLDTDREQITEQICSGCQTDGSFGFPTASSPGGRPPALTVSTCRRTICSSARDNKNWKAYKALLNKERKVFMGNLGRDLGGAEQPDPSGGGEVPPPAPAEVGEQGRGARPGARLPSAPASQSLRSWVNLPTREPVTCYLDVCAHPTEQGSNGERPLQPNSQRSTPDVEKRPAQSSSQPVMVVVGVVLVLIICVGILLAGLCWKRRKRNADKKCSLEKGCQNLLGKAHPGFESELISYPLQRGALDALPNPPLNG